MKPFHLQWPRVRHRPLHISRRSLGDSKHGHGIERVQQRMERLHAHGPAATCQKAHVSCAIPSDPQVKRNAGHSSQVILTLLLPAALCLSMVRLRAANRAARFVQSHKCMRRCLEKRDVTGCHSLKISVNGST